MRILSLDVSNLRVIERCRLEPAAGLNWITGPNGAGKTSLLEAIYLAGRGRTFRHADAGPMIRRGTDHAQVVVGLGEPAGTIPAGSVLGVRRERRSLQCRLDGRNLHRRSELAGALPLQWLGSQPQYLLNSGPETRRRFLDAGLFHVEPSCLSALAELHRCYQQRNAALKTGQRRQVDIWDGPFVEAAYRVNQHRREFVDDVASRLSTLLEAWQVSFRVEVRYRPGWPAGRPLEEVLSERRDAEIQQGFTSLGPQRADLDISMSGQVAEKQLSRGQQKVLVFALNLALADLVAERRGVARLPVLLVDDFAAELDAVHQRLLVDELSRRELQVFLTLVDTAMLAPSLRPRKVFHVEHGTLK